MISISKAEHLPSFWNRGPGELEMAYYNSQRPEKCECEKFLLS